jgi:hypothetical protein
MPAMSPAQKSPSMAAPTLNPNLKKGENTMAYYDQNFMNRMFEAFETYSFMPRPEQTNTSND